MRTALVRVASLSIRVSSKGVRGYTLWGWPALARWNDIEEVSFLRSQGVPYLAIRRRSARSLVLVCDELYKRQEFDNAVAGFIEGDHPLQDWPLQDWILPDEPTSPGASGPARFGCRIGRVAGALHRR